MIGVNYDITARKEAEQRIRESEQRLQAVFNAVGSVPVQGYDKSRRAIFWNFASERLYGYSSEEAMGRTLDELILPQEQVAAIAEKIRRWHDDGISIPAGEVELRRKDGSPVHVYSNHVMITNANGQKEMFCIDVDLTEIRRMQTRVAALAAVVENSDSIIVVKDLDLRVIATNRAFADGTGHASVEAMIGKTDAEIFGVPEDVEPIRSYMEDERRAQTLARGQYIMSEEPVILPSGERKAVLTKKYPIFDAAGKLIATGNISTDITDRKRVEEALQKSEERYRHAVEATQDGLWDWNVTTGEVDWSPRCFPMLGYEPDAFPVTFERWRELIHPDDSVRTIAAVMDQIALAARLSASSACARTTATTSGSLVAAVPSNGAKTVHLPA